MKYDFNCISNHATKHRMVLNKKEKEELVIKLLNEGKSTREIAQLAHVSLIYRHH